MPQHIRGATIVWQSLFALYAQMLIVVKLFKLFNDYQCELLQGFTSCCLIKVV